MGMPKYYEIIYKEHNTMIGLISCSSINTTQATGAELKVPENSGIYMFMVLNLHYSAI